MDPDFRLETERLRLRPYRQNDLDDLHAMFSDAEHMTWYPAPFGIEETRGWIDRRFEEYREDGFGLWIVEDRATGAFLGTAGPAVRIVDETRHIEIGWHTRPGRKGEGIAPEAGAAACDWAFENLDVDHLISIVRPENVASGRVAEKIGMHVDHETDYKGLWHRIYWLDRVSWEGRAGGTA